MQVQNETIFMRTRLGMFINGIKMETGNRSEIIKHSKRKEKYNPGNPHNGSGNLMMQHNDNDPNWKGIILKEVAEIPIIRTITAIGQGHQQEAAQEVPALEDGVNQ